jgi:diaminopimelate epimerase
LSGNLYSVKEIVFHKFHGSGNDFIMIDDRNRSFPADSETIRQMCDRHFGIGADGLILLRLREGVDFDMIYFNSDGEESTMCGNGGRCIAAFADFLSLAGREMRFQAADGIHVAEITGAQGNQWNVRLRMSDVNSLTATSTEYRLDTGSPHLVLFRKDVASLHVREEGHLIRYSDRFKSEGININFVQSTDNELFVRTYERGVESETLSCGTGVTASALAWAHKSGHPGGTLNVRTSGGNLKVSFQPSGQGFEHIWLEGPAMHVFEGKYFTAHSI